MEASVATSPPKGRPPRMGPPKSGKDAVEGSAAWRLSDRIGLAICWALGLLFCAIAIAIVVYLMVQGLKYLKLSMLLTPATAGFSQSQSGGFSDALIGTLIVAVMGISIALPAPVRDRSTRAAATARAAWCAEPMSPISGPGNAGGRSRPASAW